MGVEDGTHTDWHLQERLLVDSRRDHEVEQVLVVDWARNAHLRLDSLVALVEVVELSVVSLLVDGGKQTE